MIIKSKRIVYPEGDKQEINHTLQINQIVDLNGIPLRMPLQTSKMIAYRVYKISNETPIGEDNIDFYLELLNNNELDSYSIT